MLYSRKWVLWSRIMLATVMGFMALDTSAQCLMPGTSVAFSNTGNNTTAGYANIYVLTDNAGVILKTVTSPFAAPGVDGTYLVYSINYSTSVTPVITPGQNITTAAGTCIDIAGSPASFCVTGGCAAASSSISFSTTGVNTATGYATQYVLTDNAGSIISTHASSPITAPSASGIYRIYVVNYNTENGNTAPALTASTSINTYAGSCVNISDAPLEICVTTSFPVTLVSLTAAKEGTTASLKWTTTEETNADRFEIQRSSDAKAWANIGEKAAAGESKVLISYSFTDSKPVAGLNYYRLKMIDRAADGRAADRKDGTFTYSSIRRVEFDGSAASAQLLSIYPNPVSDLLYLQDQAGAAIDLKDIKEVSIVSASGATAYKTRTVSAEGISVNHLNGGIYIVKITRKDGTVSSHKILVNK